jgi:hypothetical protein
MKANTLKTPLLLLIFNRPDTTQKVFDAIRKVQPERLYVAADGPRDHKPGEKELCEATRSILKGIDWPCEVKTLFRNENLGCGKAVSGAITWFFDQEEEGIILEDDCLPTVSFFSFCEQLLCQYRHDTRIWHIAGYNVHPEPDVKESDYFFSQETPIWGWASWRRVWQNYQLQLDALKELEEKKQAPYLKQTFLHAITSLYDFRKVAAGKINTWDYQYSFYQLAHHGLSVIPFHNLVDNIGFDDNATHKSSRQKQFTQNKASEKEYTQIKHPGWMLPDVKRDRYTYNKRTRLLKKGFVIFWYYFLYPFQKKK